VIVEKFLGSYWLFGGGWVFGVLLLVFGVGTLVFRRSEARKMARERTEIVRELPWLRFLYRRKSLEEPGVRRELLVAGVIWTSWGVGTIAYTLFEF
jgi:hypothetical protein